MAKINLLKYIPTINFLLMVVVLVFVVLQKCENQPVEFTEIEKKRLETIDSSINKLNQRQPIENKIMIIDNETFEKININDTIRDPFIVDSLFARFNERINNFKRN